ncbi:MAG: hypothetical protein EXS68_00145 [Candidatus Ryanbacteria bacterium]|nr:hypothetical protein [Candidatus Ryanbacteria bacterium]
MLWRRMLWSERGERIMLFFATLGYGVVVLVAMLLVPRTAFVTGAIALAMGMGWISWPISDFPTFVLVHILVFGIGGLAACLDGHYWYMRRKYRQQLIFLEEEDPEAVDAHA